MSDDRHAFLVAAAPRLAALANKLVARVGAGEATHLLLALAVATALTCEPAASTAARLREAADNLDGEVPRAH